MYWKRATQQGAMAGLLVVFAIWFYTLPLTAIANSGFLPRSFEAEGLFGLWMLKPSTLFGLEGLEQTQEVKQGFQYVLLNELVADAVHILEALYHEKQVACHLKLPDACVVVYGQRDRLLQVLANLLANALTFVPAVVGKVTPTLDVQNGLAVMRARQWYRYSCGKTSPDF